MENLTEKGFALPATPCMYTSILRYHRGKVGYQPENLGVLVSIALGPRCQQLKVFTSLGNNVTVEGYFDPACVCLVSNLQRNRTAQGTF